MPRTVRTDMGGHIYHVINRANARVQIFDTEADYKQFEAVLEEASERVGMDIRGQEPFIRERPKKGS